jgi:hypothetical protein
VFLSSFFDLFFSRLLLSYLRPFLPLVLSLPLLLYPPSPLLSSSSLRSVASPRLSALASTCLFPFWDRPLFFHPRSPQRLQPGISTSRRWFMDGVSVAARAGLSRGGDLFLFHLFARPPTFFSVAFSRRAALIPSRRWFPEGVSTADRGRFVIRQGFYYLFIFGTRKEASLRVLNDWGQGSLGIWRGARWDVGRCSPGTLYDLARFSFFKRPECIGLGLGSFRSSMFGCRHTFLCGGARRSSCLLCLFSFFFFWHAST